jgi:phenylpyruvate tautomerase PptA (4-oxalocrotonate tautomerase family)
MPLWNVYCPESAYSAGEKKEFAQSVTRLYVSYGLPAFYVNMTFHEFPAESFLVGGDPADDFVRIWIDQIARKVPEERERAWMEEVEETIAPFVRDRGMRWEVHIDTTPRGMWTVGGIVPPPENSEAEQRWVAQNKPTTWYSGS